MYKFLKIIILIIFLLFNNQNSSIAESDKIKIGLLVPLTGEDKNIGQQIVKATRMALKDINENNLEIYLKDTNSNPDQTFRSALEFQKMGIKIVIGPIFFKSLSQLEEIQEITFLSFTNRTLKLPVNVISAGVNASSQLNTIKNFLKLNDLNRTILLTPKLDYEDEIKTAIKKTEIKIIKHHIYDTEPTKLTAQIEKITNYKKRKKNLEKEIQRIENSDLIDKEKQLEKLSKKYTIGNVNFDSVIISDFDESLKSVITSLIYSDVSPENKYIITFNQWFDESLLNEKTIQPLFYPSINRKNLKSFEKKFVNEFSEYPNYLSLLSYDLVGLIYYLSFKDGIENPKNLFKKKSSFKGKIGVFNVRDNKINHKLNFYQIARGEIREIF